MQQQLTKFGEMKEASDLNDKVAVDAYINSVLPVVRTNNGLHPQTLTKAFITIPNLKDQRPDMTPRPGDKRISGGSGLPGTVIERQNEAHKKFTTGGSFPNVTQRPILK